MERFDIQLSRVEEMCTQILYQLHKQEGLLLAMTTADTNLLQAIQDVSAAYTGTVAAMEAELVTLRAAQTPTDDPAVLDSINKLQKLAQDIRSNTAVMQQATTPTSPTTTATPTDSTLTQPVSTTAAPTASDPTTTHGAVPTAVSPEPIVPVVTGITTDTPQAPTTGLPVAAPTDPAVTEPVTTAGDTTTPATSTAS